MVCLATRARDAFFIFFPRLLACLLAWIDDEERRGGWVYFV